MRGERSLESKDGDGGEARGGGRGVNVHPGMIVKARRFGDQRRSGGSNESVREGDC